MGTLTHAAELRDLALYRTLPPDALLRTVIARKSMGAAESIVVSIVLAGAYVLAVDVITWLVESVLDRVIPPRAASPASVNTPQPLP